MWNGLGLPVVSARFSKERRTLLGFSQTRSNAESFDGDPVKNEELLWGAQPSNFHKIIRPQSLKPSNFYKIISFQLTEAWYTKRRRGKASLSLDVQQYSSRTGHHVVKGKMRALHVRGGLFTYELVTLV